MGQIERGVMIVLLGVGLLVGGGGVAGAQTSNRQRCELKWLKAESGHSACVFKARARAIKAETAPDYTACEAKFERDFRAAQALYGADCPTSEWVGPDGRHVPQRPAE